jgi:hypothetical protein
LFSKQSIYTSFILGVSFVWGGVFSLFRKTRIFICRTGCNSDWIIRGKTFVNANEYRRDWTLTKDFFWQLKWRAPAIAENTVFITNVLPIRFKYGQFSYAPLNWIYADGYVNQTMPYML